MSKRLLGGGTLLCGLMAALAGGCKKSPPEAAPPSVPVVPYSTPVERTVNDYAEYTGRLDARQSAGIKARATGYLTAIGTEKDKAGQPLKNKNGKPITIREGSEVEADTVLFEIDPRPYEYQLAQAKSQVTVVERQLKLAQILLARAQLSLAEKVGSQQDVDQADASAKETQARLEAAQTAVKTYQLNLDFTKVTAPFAGVVSRFFYLPGNLIVQDQTLLATLVDIQQVYAYFDMDTRTFLKLSGELSAGKITKTPVGNTQVEMALEGEGDFPHRGTLDFINNVVNPATGTISVRAIYDNAKTPTGSRLMVPGMFVRTRLPIGAPHPGLLVVDRAIVSEQGLKYVYVIGSDNRVQLRRVVPGALQDDGLRVINNYTPQTAKEPEMGLHPDDHVVVGSLPQLRAGMEVSPEKVEMPIPGAATYITTPEKK